MAAIDDLIAQIDDRALRERLRTEADRLTKNKKFGLVFEDHLPELTAIHELPITHDARVARHDRPIHEVWRVLAVDNNLARCVPVGGGEQASFNVGDLVVVRQFGEPIFPALEPVDRIANGGENDPWHTLIEADNYHALQLLEYCYAGQVDCIYIDPPYNTGARDWKYNNDYVDANDRWRHSKWLAMMQRRLEIAKRLLNPKNGVLIVTIDEHEVHHLGNLLSDLFAGLPQQLASIVINQKGVAQGRLSRAEEYAHFVFMPEAYLSPASDDLLSPERQGTRFSKPRWERLLRGGTNSRREDRPRLFFPVYVDPETQAITGVGDYLPLPEQPDETSESVAWPVRRDGSLGNWRVSPPTLRNLLSQGYVKLGGYDEKRKTWTVLYLGEKPRRQIEEGVIRIVDRDPVTRVVDVEYAEAKQWNIKTVWHRGTHDSGIYGSDLLRKILRNDSDFAFPKSIYATADAVSAVVRNQPNALVLDFFAGSGTTLHAVNLLNANDGGNRRCILVTNNEVSEGEAKNLAKRGLRPGDMGWESEGICRAVTWPRSKYTILGRRDDGTVLDGEYYTGRQVEKEKPRRFKHLDFIDPAALTTQAKKKRLLALIDELPQNTVTTDNQAFVVMADKPASILFDENAADDWLAALADQDQIVDFYIVAAQAKTFRQIRDRVNERLGPYTVSEEDKRPMADGFAANLEYFKLCFLDKAQVALGRRFAEILPILWLRAGAIGPRPELDTDEPEPAMLLPASNRFAVLLDEHQFRSFSAELAERADLTHVFLVTDSPEAFAEMAGMVGELCPRAEIAQLYRDYLENFLINREWRA